MKILWTVFIVIAVICITGIGSLIAGQVFPVAAASFLSAILGIGLGYIGGMKISEIWGWI